jgi:HNH endonuclease
MITKRLRYEILLRDGHRCRYCGATASETRLTVDHVIPTALGGKTEPENLAAACADCNSGKSSTRPDQPIVADVARDAIRLRDAMRAMAYEATLDRADLRAKITAIDQHWQDWRLTDGSDSTLPRPADWMDSAERFLQLGLSIDDIKDAIDRAMRRTKLSAARNAEWRYACGILWRWLEERQERAVQQLRIEAAEHAHDQEVADR